LQLYLLSPKSLSSIETQSLPSLLRCHPRSFTFYLEKSLSSIPEFLINFPLPQIQNFGVGCWAPARDLSELSVGRLLLFFSEIFSLQSLSSIPPFLLRFIEKKRSAISAERFCEAQRVR